MGQNNLAYSLIFKIVDGASAKIREIAQLMAEPTAAVEALGEASEASSARQVSAFAKVKAALGEVSDAITQPIGRMAALGRAAGEAAQKFSTSMAGMGAVVAEGFSIKNVAAQEEFFRRLQINTGLAKGAIDELRESMTHAADRYGVTKDKMVEAFQSYRTLGGDIGVFRRNAELVAATMQLTGMEAGNAGQLFAFLQTKMHITQPEQFLGVLATMKKQLFGVNDGVDAFAEASMRLSASMADLGKTGADATMALSAVYAVAARSTGGGGRRAIAATEGWLSQLADRGYQNQLSQGLGERVTDPNGHLIDLRVLMQKMAAKYAEALRLPENQQVVAIQRLDALFGESASKMFKSVGGEIKSTGHSNIMEQVLGAQGNGGEYLGKATQASEGLTGSMNRLRTAMDTASESLFAGPINLFAAALSHCTGAVAKVVIGLASLVAVGTAINWINGAVGGLRLLGSALVGVLPALWGFVGAMAPVITATVAWTAALLANPVTWIVVGIGLLIFGIYELVKHWKAVWAMMPAPVKAAWEFISSGFTWLSKKLGIDWGKIGETIGGVFQAIRGWAEPVINWVADKVGWLLGGIGKGVDWIKDKLGMGSGGGTGATASGVGPAMGSAPGGGALATAAGAPKVGDVTAFFRAKGWSAQAAAGIAASLHAESGFRAGAVGDHGQAYGLAQWHADRQAEFAKVFGHSIIGTNWQEQAAFVDWELRHKEGAAGRAIAGAGSAAQAGALMSSLYERPANRQLEAMRRAQLAMRIEGGASLPVGGGQGGSALAMGGNRGAGFDYGTVVPSSIYGPAGGGAQDAAPLSALAAATTPGRTEARAHLTVEIKDGRVKTHLDHSANMEATLDRGAAMTMKWG